MAALNVIFGGGGVAREVSWLLSEAEAALTPDMFVVADADWIPGSTIDGIPILPDREFLAASPVEFAAYLAVGLPWVRRRLEVRLAGRAGILFPSIAHASARMDRRPGRTRLGRGVVIYPLASLTTGVVLEDFVQVNPCATLGHGVHVGAHTTICPGANISGEVTLGAGCFIGAGAVIREGLRIADDCVIGAGTVVVRDLETGTWAGVPARKLDR